MSHKSMANQKEDALEAFLPSVGQWFRENLGAPTPTQAQSWPHIRGKENTLILAPTGSGKTLAAFLVCLDELWREKKCAGTTRVLYLSPLKALNNDIQRNLARPLEGILAMAKGRGGTMVSLTVAVRTGDTTQQERQAQIRKPPDILITTPESLHLLLTSRGRATLGGVSHVIVDEIHAMVPNKRGVFLSLLLERLEEIRAQAGNHAPLVRIGLSATQRPMSEVARFLGGYTSGPDGRVHQRPVTLIDGGIRKELDLEVVSPLEGLGRQGEKGVWPGIYRLLRKEIEAHQSTIVFANDRRAVERITSWVNGDSPVAQSHHGSVSLEKRRQTEEDLKKGLLKAVVATASLEMGIDMGSVDLVMQVESPGSVSRALQRVGRAGHIVGMKSKGRMIPKTHPDLVEMAVLAREMKHGRVEEVKIPTCSLDILCQQIVSMVAMEDWEVERLLGVVRRAAPYRDLTAEAFEQALELVSGRYRFGRKMAEGGEEVIPSRASTLEALQPRISWDRVHQRLRALPGSQHLSLVNGGAIPDTGNFAVIGPDGSRIGELDEEFIYERRVGESFLLGTTVWCIEKIEVDRVVVRRAEGELAQLPFWRGEGPGRCFELGKAMGVFLRELEQRLEDPDRIEWLCKDYQLDRAAARGLCGHITRQLLSAGVIPTDKTLLIEASRDSLGDWQVLVLSPLGARFHLGLRLALESVLKELLGYRPRIHHHDDGLVIRMTDTDSPILDLLERLDPAELEDRILGELADSPLFAIRFRQNASRALLLPRAQPGKRSPLWLQRLRGRDLLQVARKHPDFPIIAETYRECLMDHLELVPLREFLESFRRGAVSVVKRQAEAPCPFSQDVLFTFTAENLYQTDIVEPESQTGQKLDRGLLDQILPPEAASDSELDEASVRQSDLRIRGLTLHPRTRAEMAEILRRLGDLTERELVGSMGPFAREMVEAGEAVSFPLKEPSWVFSEYIEQYKVAFGSNTPGAENIAEKNSAAKAILGRYLAGRALVGAATILSRYPFDREWLLAQLEDWTKSGRAVSVARKAGSEPLEWALPGNLEQVRRTAISIRRREIRPVTPGAFGRFLLGWQGVNGPSPATGLEGVAGVLENLEGIYLPLEAWEKGILPSRIVGYQPAFLDQWCDSGQGVWAAGGLTRNGPERVAFWSRVALVSRGIPEALMEEIETDTPGEALAVLEKLSSGGAQFVMELSLATKLDPSLVREGLWSLVAKGRVTNDKVQVLRSGRKSPAAQAIKSAKETAVSRPGAGMRPARMAGLRSLRPGISAVPEGRWSLIPWGHPDLEARLVFCAELLLKRYGVVTRELAQLDPLMPSWKILYEIYGRMELSGEVRRGHLIEGFEGAQFALPEAVDSLRLLEPIETSGEAPILLHSMDPTHIQGSLDAFLLKGMGGKSGLSMMRKPANWVVLQGGDIVLGLEFAGQKLSVAEGMSESRVRESLQTLIKGATRLGTGPSGHLPVCVQTINGVSILKSPLKSTLIDAGFVSDLNRLTFYPKVI